MSGYKASKNDGSNRTNNDNTPKQSSFLSGLKDGAKAAMGPGLGSLSKPSNNNDFGKKNQMPNPATLAKNNEDNKNSLNKESSKNDDDNKSKNNEKEKIPKGKQSKLDKFKNGVDKLRRDKNSDIDVDDTEVGISMNVIKTAITFVGGIVTIFPFLLIFIVLLTATSILLKYNNENNFYNITASIGGGSSSQSADFGPSDGTQGSYYAPVQNVSGIKFGSISGTSGCNNNVSHDISGIAEGTTLYAGMDGTAEFKQIHCGDELYSYGNEVKITAKDGTYIIYGHLKEFTSDVNLKITKTCPKKGSTPPCPYTTCKGNLESDVIATKEVKKGEVIGSVGNTGNSTGTHLHVEIHSDQSGRRCIEDPWKSFGMR